MPSFRPFSPVIIVAVVVAVLFLSSCPNPVTDPEETGDAAGEPETLFTVTFDTRGGNAIDAVIVPDGALVPEPSEPSREGWVFQAWYTAANLAVTWNFSIDTVRSDVTLYAGWACDEGLTQVGDACEAESILSSCLVQSPLEGVDWAGGSRQYYARVGTSSAPVDGAIPGLLVKVCYSDAAIATPIAFGDMTCFDAELNPAASGPEHEFTAHVTFGSTGRKEIVFAISENDAQTYTFCDVNGIVDSAVEPAVMDVVGPTNGGFEVWSDTGHVGELPFGWSPASDIIVAKETERVHSGLASVRLERGSTTNMNNELSSVLAPVDSGVTYTIRMWFYDNDPTARSGLISQWYDADGVSLGAAVFPGGDGYTVDRDEWQLRERTVTAPEGAAFVRVAVRVYAEAGAATGGVIYLDDVTVAPVD